MDTRMCNSSPMDVGAEGKAATGLDRSEVIPQEGGASAGATDASVTVPTEEPQTDLVPPPLGPPPPTTLAPKLPGERLAWRSRVA